MSICRLARRVALAASLCQPMIGGVYALRLTTKVFHYSLSPFPLGRVNCQSDAVVTVVVRSCGGVSWSDWIRGVCRAVRCGAALPTPLISTALAAKRDSREVAR